MKNVIDKLAGTGLRVLVPLLAFTACSVNDTIEPTMATEPESPIRMALGRTISTGSPLEVSVEAVENIIREYSPHQTFATTSLPAYSLSTLYGEDGTPRIYVVNYPNNGGWVMISATKALTPVLAYNDSGNYPIDSDRPDAVCFWEKMTIESSEIAETLPTDSLKAALTEWQRYEPKPISTPVTTLSTNDDIYDDPNFQEVRRQLMEKRTELSQRGDVVIYEPGQMIDDDEMLTRTAWETAEGSTYPLYMEHWQELCFVAKIMTVRTSKVDNLLDVNWGQGDGFNKFCPEINGEKTLVGCTAVGGAQLMSYYKWPSYYEWDKMSKNKGDDYNALLLYDVAVKIETIFGKDASSSNIKKLSTGLKSYGYNVTLVESYNTNKLGATIYNNIPVAIDGINTQSDDAHLWNVCGVYRNDLNYEYILYLPYYRARMEEWILGYDYEYYYGPFYMNWGWTGIYNGWYYISPTISEINRTYKVNNYLYITR